MFTIIIATIISISTVVQWSKSKLLRKVRNIKSFKVFLMQTSFGTYYIFDKWLKGEKI